jgi:cytochrome c556
MTTGSFARPGTFPQARRWRIAPIPGLGACRDFQQKSGEYPSMKKILAVSLVLAVSGAAVAAADTHEDREALMKQNGAALKALGGAATAPALDAALVKAQSQILIDNAAKIPTLFAPGTETADDEALPAVWNNAAEFKAAAAKLGSDAQAVQGATDQASLAVALISVQGDCGSCHSAFRAPRKPRPH